MIAPRLRIIGPRPRRTPHVRPLRRQSLTLAVGFNCTDGILICADQKHTDGVSQFHADKIFQVNGEGVQILVALAGHMDYGKMVVDSLRENIDVCTNMATIKASVHGAVKKVFVDRISTVFQNGDPSRPQIQAIMGVTACASDPTFKPVVWKVVDASINKIAGFDAVGTGQDIARLYLKWLYPTWDIFVPVHVAHTLASHIENLAEIFDPDCGLGFTMQAMGGNPSVAPASHFGGVVHREFKDFMYALRQVFLGCMDHECTPSMMEVRLREFSQAAMTSKREDERINKEWATQTADSRKKNMANAKKIAARLSASRKTKGQPKS